MDAKETVLTDCDNDQCEFNEPDTLSCKFKRIWILQDGRCGEFKPKNKE